MKKILFITASIVLLAAACNQQAAVQPAPAPAPTNQCDPRMGKPCPPAGDQINSAVPASWKTYTNAKFGYSIQYPDIEQGPGNDTESSHSLFLGGNANVFISVHGLNDDFNGAKKYHQYTSKIINGMTVDQSQEYGTLNYLFITTLFTGSHYIYEVEFSDEHNSKKVELLNQVLRTFKFTDPAQAPLPLPIPEPCPQGTVPIGRTEGIPGSFICGPDNPTK